MNLFNMTDIGRSAELSDCGKYRYQLTRCWRPEIPKLGWIMLNPSTADALSDDPTIRKCMKFSRAWGYGGIVVGNLFHLRATNPAELLSADGGFCIDVFGSKMPADVLGGIFDHCEMVMAAWGSHAVVERAQAFITPRLIAHQRKRSLHCLAINGDGAPRHPLYVRDDTKPVVWFDPKDGVA